MSALKDIAARFGATVSGSDVRTGGHDKNNITGKDLVVYSGAIPDDNEELSYARKLGVPTTERSEFLALIAGFFDKTIAVAGCHGKTTTTAMLGETLAVLNPTVHLGGEYKFGYEPGENLFVTEACEYRRSFLALKPDVAVITNVDFDHPDTYRNTDEVLQAFSVFIQGSRNVIYNGDDPLLKKTVESGTSVGFGSDNDYVVRVFGNSFDMYYRDAYAGTFSPRFDQPFNIKNAALAIAASYSLGTCYRDVKAGIERFRGVARRGEVVCLAHRCTVISDYSHHPAEISERIQSLKKQYGAVAVIFQPHTYSRTIALADRFSRAFSLADETVFTDTFAAREKKGDDLYIYDLCRDHAVCSFVRTDELRPEYERLTKKYPCVALMGAGDFQAKLLEKQSDNGEIVRKSDEKSPGEEKNGQKG